MRKPLDDKLVICRRLIKYTNIQINNRQYNDMEGLTFIVSVAKLSGLRQRRVLYCTTFSRRMFDEENVLINLVNPIFHSQTVQPPLRWKTNPFDRFRCKLGRISYRMNTFRAPWDFCWQPRQYLAAVYRATRFAPLIISLGYLTVSLRYLIVIFEDRYSVLKGRLCEMFLSR